MFRCLIARAVEIYTEIVLRLIFVSSDNSLTVSATYIGSSYLSAETAIYTMSCSISLLLYKKILHAAYTDIINVIPDSINRTKHNLSAVFCFSSNFSGDINANNITIADITADTTNIIVSLPLR